MHIFEMYLKNTFLLYNPKYIFNIEICYYSLHLKNITFFNVFLDLEIFFRLYNSKFIKKIYFKLYSSKLIFNPKIHFKFTIQNIFLRK